MSNVAVVDCGSNSTRLLVTTASGESVLREMRMTRLSEGVDASRRLTPEAMERTRLVLTEYRTRAESFGPCDLVVVATSAVRDALNRHEFVEMAREATGGEVAVISGSDEARYSFRGATSHLDSDGRPPVVLDIGGGSSELALEWSERLWGYSTNLGCVRVTERVLGTGPLDPVRESAARSMIDEELHRALEVLTPLVELRGQCRLVGLAGTVATLAQLVFAVATYDRAAVHHRRISRDEVAYWRRYLGGLTPAERAHEVGMVAGREDVIVAGLLVLEGVMDLIGAEDLVTSEDDILDGVAAEVRAGTRPVTMER